jgi:large subunit ribosomal protein L9
MKVILLEDVDNLGVAGDKKDVAPGYAKNYLIPQGFAVRSDDMKAKILLKNISKNRIQSKKEIVQIKKTVDKYKNKKIVFDKVKTTKQGKLFGSIGKKEISEKLNLDEKFIEMDSIKTIGEHKAIVNLDKKEKIEIKIIVKK